MRSKRLEGKITIRLTNQSAVLADCAKMEVFDFSRFENWRLFIRAIEREKKIEFEKKKWHPDF